MSGETPMVRIAADVAYVSFDAGRTWWSIQPDGTTLLRFRQPLAMLLVSEYGRCPHDCAHCALEDGDG